MSLAILTTHFNIAGYTTPRENYFRFRDNLGDVPLFTAELSFDDQFYIDDALHLKGEEKHMMWQKERMLNVLLDSLPEEYTSVAWIDADIIFHEKDWYDRTLKALEFNKVVQMFSQVEALNKQGRIVEVHPSFMWNHAESGSTKILRTGHAWAAQRKYLSRGFMDQEIIGGGDAVMMRSWMGLWLDPQAKKINNEWKKNFLIEGRKRYKEVQGNVGYVVGGCTHLYHGSRKNRQYTERAAILAKNNYDPNEDIVLDGNLWAWNTDKPEMHQKVKGYFFDRKEDD